jgi:hypothetical protein
MKFLGDLFQCIGGMLIGAMIGGLISLPIAHFATKGVSDLDGMGVMLAAIAFVVACIGIGAVIGLIIAMPKE